MIKEDVLREIEFEVKLVDKLRKIGYGDQIDIAYSVLDRGETTEYQYWEYIKQLAAKALTD